MNNHSLKSQPATSPSELTSRSRLDVTYRVLSQLTPDPRNARLHSSKQVRQIARSIESFGFNVPVLLDGAHRIIAGHGRVQAAKLLGLAEIPTIRLDHLSDAQRRAFMIADNRLTEIASWDDHLLGETLKELSAVDLDFDLEATGFDIADIDLRIETLSNPDGPPAEAEIAAPVGPPVTEAGDLWLLGRHKVLCGDARDASGYARLLGSERCALIFTDPPYNVQIAGHVSGLGQVHHREFPMASGEMDPGEFAAFLQSFLAQCIQSAQPGALAYVCMDWRHVPELVTASAAAGLKTLNLCVWTKPNAGMGSFYRSQHELIFVFKIGTHKHRNNVQLGSHGRNRTNVWAYAAGPGFGRASEEGRLAALHPTVKPVAMAADAILDCSRRGDIVLDPFLGSGTTLMAAERVGRRCHGMELDPLYVDVIVRRWQSCAGSPARHAMSGATFEDVAALRESAR